MSKRLNKYKALVDFVKKNSSFEIHNNVLFCTCCNEINTYNPKEGVTPLKRHMACQTHLKKMKIQKPQARLDFGVITTSEMHIFHKKLATAFTKANIPLYKLQNIYLKTFIEEIGLKKVNDESFYRKTIINEIFIDELKKIKTFYSDKPIYMIFDETTDGKGRFILNVLIGECSKIVRSKPALVRVIELTKTNSENINIELFQVLNILYDGDTSKFKNLKLLLSDGASYALKAGLLLKNIITELKHVTCVCHAMHNLCEKIRIECENVNLIISFLKRILVKNRINQEAFKSIVKKNIPEFPIITRWGTWIEFALYVFENFSSICTFILNLSTETVGLTKILDCIVLPETENEFRSIYNHKTIVSAIKTLESDSLSTEEQVSIVKKIEAVTEQHRTYFSRFRNIILRNPDFEFFQNFNPLKSSTEDQWFRYIPLTTVSVERSFSFYNNLFCDNRRRLRFENLEKLLIIYYNKDLFD